MASTDPSSSHSHPPIPHHDPQQAANVHNDSSPPTSTNPSKRKRPHPCFSPQSFTPSHADPWIHRKFGVGFLIALSAYSVYVVIGRVCVPVLRRDAASGWTIADGAGVLVGYIILTMLYGWSYFRMVTVGPGFAKNLLPQVPPPDFTNQTAPINPHASASDTAAHNPTLSAQAYPGTLSDETPDPAEIAPTMQVLGSAMQPVTTNNRSSSATLTSQAPITTSKGKRKPDLHSIQRPVPEIHYGPRWCRFCHINKPDRAHHCRHCGTCVLQFDHHCLWVGQCVGWGNHKFFMTFNLWASMFCIYMLITLVIYMVQTGEVDPQLIVIIAMSGLFGLFTVVMFSTHVYLIMTGKSTVESFSGQDQSQHEARTLQTQLGFWNNTTDGRKVKKMWREEWGGSQVDERWRTGGAMFLWKQEMGERWYEWIFPLDRPLGDGMHFPANPRFGPNGEWLRKRDWPEGVV